MVAHLVHKNAAGQLAVEAVLFKDGKEDAALKDIFNALPEHESQKALKANRQIIKVKDENESRK